MPRITLLLLALTLAANAQARLPQPAHVVVVIEENKSFSDVIGSPNAPYLNALARRGATLTGFYASHHPSQPNYIELFAGDTLGVCDDSCPRGPFTANNLGAALLASGKSFVGFAEDVPKKMTCDLGNFAKRHCPWLDFSNVPPAAASDFSKFPKDFRKLPAVSFVIPSLVHDMHDGKSVAAEVKAGDRWLRANLGAYARWAQTHNSLLIVTWDEDSDETYHVHCPDALTTAPPTNRIPTIIVGQHVRRGSRVGTAYGHHDLLRTILDMYGIAPFAGARGAADIDGIWR
jgi:phosphatidylinositol-3-phosphatase